MARNIASLFAVSFVLMSSVASAFGQAEKTSLSNSVIARVLERQIDQTKIGDCPYSGKPFFLYKQMKLSSAQDGDLRISGFSNDGSGWNASIEFAQVARCEVWTAELSPGNPPSIIILTWGIDSSGDWGTNLSLLLFDEQGKPMPWQAISHFDINEKGVQEIVRLPGQEKVSIVIPIQEGDRFNGFTYLYDLYDIVGDRVQRVTDVRYGVKWPLIPPNRPDIEAHHLLDTLTTVEPMAKAGLNESPSHATRLVHDSSDKNIQIELENGSPMSQSCPPPDCWRDSGAVASLIRRPKIMVEDRAEHERSIIFGPSEDDLRKLAEKNTTTKVIGKRCDWDECSPLILKATLTR